MNVLNWPLICSFVSRIWITPFLLHRFRWLHHLLTWYLLTRRSDSPFLNKVFEHSLVLQWEIRSSRVPEVLLYLLVQLVPEEVWTWRFGSQDNLRDGALEFACSLWCLAVVTEVHHGHVKHGRVVKQFIQIVFRYLKLLDLVHISGHSKILNVSYHKSFLYWLLFLFNVWILFFELKRTKTSEWQLELNFWFNRLSKSWGFNYCFLRRLSFL